MYLLYWYIQQNQCLNIKNMMYTTQYTTLCLQGPRATTSTGTDLCRIFVLHHLESCSFKLICLIIFCCMSYLLLFVFQEKSENGNIHISEGNKMIDNFTDGIRLIILDLSGVTFLDVVGVKALRRVCNHQIVSCINNPCCLFRRV